MAQWLAVTDLEELFWRAHRDLPREAPGSPETTRLLLQLAGELPPTPTVLDVGCGTGPATVLLAELTGGHVTGVDTHQPFLDALITRAAAAGVGNQVTGLNASMDDLPIEPGTVDVVWAEGSAYIIGFDNALASWRPLLSPSGVLVLTEAGWTTPDPSSDARAFWDAGYPGMRTTAENVAAAQQAGWTILAAYLLPDSDWDAYYAPLAARIEQLRADGAPADLLAVVHEEIGVRAKHARDYGYTGYVLRPRREGPPETL